MNNLSQLVASLNGSEKAYFKRWVPKTGKDKDYLRLFDLIDRKPDIDSTALRSNLKLNSKQLSSLKNHLWQTLLSSLRDYHRKHSLYIDLRSKQDYIQVLRLKGQLQLAEKEALRLIKYCNDVQAYTYRYRALEQLEGIYISAGSSDANWDWVYSEKRSCLHHLAQRDRMREIERKLAQVTIMQGVSGEQLSSKNVKKQLDGIEAELVELAPSNETSVDVRYRFYQINAIIGRIRFDHEREFEHFRKVLDLGNEFPRICERLFINFYGVCIHNLIIASFLTARFDGVPELLERLRLQKLETEEWRLRNFYFLTHDTLAYLHLVGKFEEGLSYWENVRDEVEETTAFNLIESSQILFLGAVLQFWNGKFKETRKSLNQLLSIKNLTEENLSACRMLSLVVAYEIEDRDHLEHLIRSYNRIWQQNRTTKGLELIVTKYLSKWCSTPERYDVERFLSEVETCIENPLEHNKLFFFDLKSYLEKQLINSAKKNDLEEL